MHDWKQECIHLEQRGGTCHFSDNKGCCTSQIPGGCLPVVDQCLTAGIELVTDPKNKEKQIENRVPCKRIANGVCSSYISPPAKWRAIGALCPFAGKMVTEEASKKINPLKASKRAAGKKA
jgi:hypothetical protein